jgi:uncharacterized protein YdeI (YjbR/CyaY-like superfamily)
MAEHRGLPVHGFSALSDWVAWLEQNFDRTEGIWVKIYKKASGAASVSYEDVRAGCLMFGWIDSVPNKLDDRAYLLKVTPRRPRSIWSQINRDICEQLIKEGKMRPSGLAQVEAAKADGRWAAAYGSQSTAEPGEDFLAALTPEARKFFDSLTRSQRYSFIFKIDEAKRSETRSKRIRLYAEMLHRGEKLT